MATIQTSRLHTFDRDELPGLPGALTPAQRMAALQRLQAMADQRLKLSSQLFRAAQAEATRHQRALDQVKADQARLRDELTRDLAKSLQSYDQWVGQVEDRLAGSMQALDVMLENLTRRVKASEDRLTQMMQRAEALFDQVRSALDAMQGKPAPR